MAIDVWKAHGSQNDLLLAEASPGELAGIHDPPSSTDQAGAEPASAELASAEPASAELAGLVRRLCDRSGPLGADGIYFVDSSSLPAQAWFFNPDGSPAAFCGNGMRCVGRLLLDRYQVSSVQVRSGDHEFTVRRAAPTPEGVAQTVVELPPVELVPDPPVVAGGGGHIDEPMPVLHPAHRFTALAVPNPHLVSIVADYDEDDLVAVGQRVAASPAAFPAGANVSYVLPLTGEEVFVRTFERGAGLTMSCGSGVAAARAVCSRVGRFPAEQPLVVRNRGGVARAWLHEQGGRWFPRVEGNATFVYQASIVVAGTAHVEIVNFDTGRFGQENAAFAAADRANLAALGDYGLLPVAGTSPGSPAR